MSELIHHLPLPFFFFIPLLCLASVPLLSSFALPPCLNKSHQQLPSPETLIQKTRIHVILIQASPLHTSLNSIKLENLQSIRIVSLKLETTFLFAHESSESKCRAWNLSHLRSSLFRHFLYSLSTVFGFLWNPQHSGFKSKDQHV